MPYAPPMSTRSRKTLQMFAYLLGMNIILAVLAHFRTHESWSRAFTGPVYLGLVVAGTAYTWWFYSSPERVAKLQARKAERRMQRLG